mgnify:CR=1 FL=1
MTCKLDYGNKDTNENWQLGPRIIIRLLERCQGDLKIDDDIGRSLYGVAFTTCFVMYRNLRKISNN